ncbi:PQQ-binding-like beta-propeller repeat protein [Conexibacter sp. CPCC 206217]|uniref:outer membrane protein assembly factor BamB family protein n=1 Tax=Conexibacter sp. CPCC 206217 TaxID=3064574 RepID=UPI00271F98AA|nr:PQQ-binding-like beta-propeller repeat protein [Conexibacter sp. CPCC 206217]MDO8211335.1 PQQ-binding-like beta-propeller repeat protein [Conexibacter sp. CPCC 206217]
MSQEPRITRRGLLSTGAGLALGALAAEPAIAAAAARHRRAHGQGHGGGHAHRGAWPLPAHDLAATRAGDRLKGAAVRWRASFPGGVPASAAIDGGVVFAASAAGAVAALNLSDGHERWRRELGTAEYGSGADRRALGFFAGVALDGRRVLVASDRAYALDARSGRTLWQSVPLRTPTSDDYHWGLPAVAGGLVLIGSGSGAELPTARGRLSTYRLRDGRLLWSTATVPEGANGGGIIGPPSVDERLGLVYVATGSPYGAVPGINPGTCSLIALRLRDGGVVWEDQVHAADRRGFDFNSAPVIAGRLLIATAKDGIYAWDRLARRRLWHVQLTDPVPGGAPTAGPTTGPEGGPIAVDLTRETAYVLSNDGASGGCVAAALRLRDGRVRWRSELPGPTFAAPALAGGRTLCVAGADGTLRLLDARNGALAGQADLGEPSAAAPVLGDGRLVVGTGAQPFVPGASLVCVG